MKNIAVTGNHFQALQTGNELINHCEEQPSHHLLFKDPTVPTNAMTEHEVSPPPHVWDRIACVLDEQDRIKANLTRQLQQRKKRTALWSIAAIAAVLLAAYMLWL